MCMIFQIQILCFQKPVTIKYIKELCGEWTEKEQKNAKNHVFQIRLHLFKVIYKIV